MTISSITPVLPSPLSIFAVGPIGPSGLSAYLRVADGMIQWRLGTAGEWNDLVSLESLTGEVGPSIQLQKTATHLQWRVTGGAWANLAPLSELGVSITDASIVDGELRLELSSGAVLAPGNVVGPPGPIGPQGEIIGPETTVIGRVPTWATSDGSQLGAGLPINVANGLVKLDGTGGLPSGLAGADIQTFTGPGVWSKPANRQFVLLCGRGPGGGGGSGRRGAASSTRGGGAGGGGGEWIFEIVLASALASSVTYTPGAPGTGGAAVTANDTNGNDGTDGGNSTFGPFILHGGRKGTGGSAAISWGGAGGSPFGYFSTSSTNADASGSFNVRQGNGLTPTVDTGGGGATTFGEDLAGAPSSLRGGLGGGAGLCIKVANTTAGPSKGGDRTSGAALPVITPPTAGVQGSETAGPNGGAQGSAGGNGGPGNTGNGGAGGGASTNGANSGKGGDGDTGFLMVISL